MAVACDEADGGASSARRRRERRLRAFWRHKTFAVQCAIATATHHSAFKPRRVAYADASTQTLAPAPDVFVAPAPVADRVTYAETVEEMDLEPPLPAEPAPVTAPVVDVPVFVAPVPAVFCAAPTPEVEFRAPAPAASCAAPVPEVEFVAPTPADSCAAPPPVAEYVTQAPFEADAAPPPVVGRPGSVRRRHVVKAPPVVDSGAVQS